jgi:hypothetical protein
MPLEMSKRHKKLVIHREISGWNFFAVSLSEIVPKNV